MWFSRHGREKGNFTLPLRVFSKWYALHRTVVPSAFVVAWCVTLLSSA